MQGRWYGANAYSSLGPKEEYALAPYHRPCIVGSSDHYMWHHVRSYDLITDVSSDHWIWHHIRSCDLIPYQITWSDVISDSNIVAEYDLMSYHQIIGSDILLDMIWYRIRSLDLIWYQIVGSDIVSDHMISDYWIWCHIRWHILIPCQIIWSDVLSDSSIVLDYMIWYLISYQIISY